MDYVKYKILGENFRRELTKVLHELKPQIPVEINQLIGSYIPTEWTVKQVYAEIENYGKRNNIPELCKPWNLKKMLDYIQKDIFGTLKKKPESLG